MVTLKQIADAVGVSTATVSRVLNYDPILTINTVKRQAILETAEALNYTPPRVRNRAQKHGLHKVALVHFLRPEQELNDPYYVGLRLGIESRCQTLESEIVKAYHAERMLDSRLLKSAAGVIAIGYHNEDEIAWLHQHSRHLVFADFMPPSADIDSVKADLRLAMLSLLKILSEMGYKRIGFAGWLLESDGDPLAEERCRTYVDWMKATAGFDPDLCITAGRLERNSEQTGYEAGIHLLRQPSPPDAIVTCNDNIALGVYRAVGELGLRIPEDVAVAGFNDIPAAQFIHPPLSTVRLPAEEIGETAVDMLLERVSGRVLAKRVFIASQTIWRSSTRAS